MSMWRNALPALSGLLLATAGCRTTQSVLSDYEKDLASGRYAQAAEEVGELAEKGDDSVLLWRLHESAARYLANDRAGALSGFDRAEDVFVRNDQTSVFAQGGQTSLAMVTNERSFPYAGAGEDRVFTCFYKAVDYAADGNLAAARTEFNRAAQHQENWLWARRRDIEAAAKRLQDDSAAYARKEGTDLSKTQGAVARAVGDASLSARIRAESGFDPAVSGNLDTLSQADYLNAYVQHVCGIFRWLNGDGGRDFLRYAHDVKPGHPLVSADFAEVDSGKPKDQVWIYVEDGLCPVREEWRIDLPVVLIPYANRYVQYAGMALPRLRYRAAAHTGYTVRSGTAVTGLDELEDIDRLLKTEFDVYMRGALAREITRTLLKVGVQAGFGLAAQNARDDGTRLGLRIAQVGAATWALTTTAADLRCWTALPKKVHAARVTRPADGKLVLSGDGKPVAEINLPPGNTLVFVRKPSTGAPAVVKTVSVPDLSRFLSDR